MKFGWTREQQIPKGAVKVADKRSDAVAYLYDARKAMPSDVAMPCAMVFIGKQAKPLWRYRFPNAADREKRIAQAFADRRAWLARQVEQRAKRKAWVPTYKVGDIFRTCWGYEQTNVEYFEIVEIKGKHAILRELAQERVDTGWQRGRCVPLPGQYLSPRFDGDKQGLPIRRLMQEGRIKIDDVRTAWPVETQDVAGVKVVPPSSWTAYH